MNYSRLAWREMRAAPGKFLFVILAVAVGVGSLTGVRGFSAAFHTMLLREARQLIAGDLAVRVFSLPNDKQQAALDELTREGVQRTWVTETISMANSAAEATPLLVSIKAVDPRVYPFYGKVKLNPQKPLYELLDPQSVVVSEDVQVRMSTGIGQSIRLGGQDFRVAGIVLSEPDRMSGSLNLGLRVMISREGLERTGLLRAGSRAAQRYLLKLPVTTPLEPVRDRLKKAFPEAMISDFRESNPNINRGLERATTFLSLVSLIALIVGALGVATAMHAHLQQKLDTIAIMKSIGARSSQIMRIYSLQTIWLGMAGGLIGILVGAAVQKVFPYLIRRYFALQPEISWDWSSLLQGIVIGTLSTLLFTLPPLLSIRRIRPNLVLRRDMPDAQLSWRERWRNSRLALGAAGVILLGIGLIAAWLSDSPRMGGFFVGGLVASLLAMSGVAWLLLKGLRRFLRTTTMYLPATLRHGIANIYRPGNQAQPVLVALGIGVMFTLTVYLLQHSVLDDLKASAPPGMPNVFLLDIRTEQRDAMLALLRQQAGPKERVELVPSVSARITKVNGVPTEDLDLKGMAKRFLATRTVTWSGKAPEAARILQGKWWAADTTEPQVAVSEEAAKTLKLKPGSTMEFQAGGRTIPVRVAVVHRSESTRLNALSEFVFPAPVLQGLPTIFYGAVHLPPNQVAGLQREAYRKFPTVTVINIADALAIVQEVIDQIALVIRFLSLFAILAGVIILASSVAGTRFRRVREVVILKTLGGTRRRIASIFSVEFLILGLVAGAMGALLATAFSSLLLRRLLDAPFEFDWRAAAVATLATAIIANLAGWLASFRILGQKPLEVLRES